MSHKIEFSPEALGDLIDLYDYIALRDGAERAIVYIDRIETPARANQHFRSVVNQQFDPLVSRPFKTTPTIEEVSSTNP